MKLTPEQRRQLEELWFVYGNYGPKHTMRNHKFIQGFLEKGRDLRALYQPEPGCVQAVELILNKREKN